MIISQNFDSGNIIVKDASDPRNIRLCLRNDSHSDFKQWFHFRLSGVEGQDCILHIEDAHEAAYPDGWVDYNICASYDRETWFRLPTRYENNTLSFAITPSENSVYFAYFAPYSMERHSDLVAYAAGFGLVTPHVLGHSLDGQDMDLLELGYGPIDEQGRPRKKIWLIARQHPGETMAEWWMEGALDMLLDEDDPVAKALLEHAHFYIVPNMNPDGSRRGNLRTNAAGVNLNRAWADPSMETSPEVYLVRQKIKETGVDFHMDIHGDEGLPYNFLAGFSGIHNASDYQNALYSRFKEILLRLSPDFQKEHGYPKEAAGTADLKKCTDYIAATFGCPAMTLEMPFKDNANAPDEDFGWSPERSRALARSCLLALHQIMDDLKAS